MNRLIFCFLIALSLKLKADSNNSVAIFDTIAIDLIEKYQVDKDTRVKNGYYVLQYKGKDLTRGIYKDDQRDGEWTFIGMNDTVQQKGVYLKGMKEGLWISYYSDGKVSCYMDFKGGFKNGVFKGFYKNGNVSFEKKYVNDLAQGVATNYYPSGKVFYTETYVKDSLNGPAKRYYENGILEEEKYLKNGKRDSIYLFYYDNGNLWEKIIYRQGNEYNVIAYNSPDGKPVDCCTLKDGNGTMRFYDKEGRVTNETTYKNSMKNGYAKYLEKGIVSSEGNYIEDKYEGVWLEYYDTGELYSKISYKKNNKNGVATYFFKDGKVSKEGNFKEEDEEGVWKSYNSNGKIQSEINYLKGKYSGEARLYSDGIISTSGEYIDGKKTGYWKFYDKKGRVMSQFDYGNHVVESTQKEFYFSDMPKKKEKIENIYTIVEQMPEFPGGANEMMNFIRQNIVYPEYAKESGLMGTVYVNFVVDNTGEVRDVNIIRGVYYELDIEAMRIVSRMPRWSAGMQNGRPVSVSYNLPIKYTIR